ncbi:MAG: SCO family protein [Chitinophagaceae bacterium]
MKGLFRILLMVFFMLLGIVFLGYYYYEYKQHPKRLKVYGNPGHAIDTFSFIDQDGRVFTHRDVEGKILVVEYFFTTCQGICPKMNDQMTRVAAAFRGQSDVAILSHTVDPETDTVAQMKRYAESLGADPTQWHFLTGNKHDLYDMAVNSYLVTVVEDTTKKDVLPEFIHSEKFVLVDKEKHIRGVYDGTKPDEVNKLIKEIGELRKEYN